MDDRYRLKAHGRFYTFPNYIENTTFGISCDALANMKVGRPSVLSE